MPPIRQIKLECDLLVCCGPKDVDSETFYAINDACLVSFSITSIYYNCFDWGKMYDGRLVIDDRYRTNDHDM